MPEGHSISGGSNAITAGGSPSNRSTSMGRHLHRPFRGALARHVAEVAQPSVDVPIRGVLGLDAELTRDSAEDREVVAGLAEGLDHAASREQVSVAGLGQPR